MYYIKVILITLISTGWLTDPSYDECKPEIGDMLQQMLNDKQYNNHKASGRQYYILQNKLVTEDPCVGFGNKKLKLTLTDSGRVFRVSKFQIDSLKSKAEMGVFLINDNLSALGTFECQNGRWEMVNIKFVML